MKKCRIVKCTKPDGTIEYIIQEKHFLFRWWWVAASMNDEYTQDTFTSLEEAQKNLCWFNGTKYKYEVIG